MVERNESDVGNIDFQLLAEKGEVLHVWELKTDIDSLSAT